MLKFSGASILFCNWDQLQYRYLAFTAINLRFFRRLEARASLTAKFTYKINENKRKLGTMT